MSNERTHRLSWPPEGCPDWCVYDEHPEDSVYEDRTHHNDALLMRLSAAELVNDHVPFIGVEIDQHYREVEPRVQVITWAHLNDLTLDEAEQLAHALLMTVAAGRTGGPIVPASDEPSAEVAG